MKNTQLFKAVLICAFTLLSSYLVAQTTENEVGRVARLSTKVIDRPAVIPTGMVDIDTNAKMKGLKTVGIDFKSHFGIVDHVEGRLNFDGFTFNGARDKVDHKFMVERIVTLGTKYNFYNIPHVGFSATAALPIHVLDGEIVQNVVFGAPITFYNDIMAGGILGDVFDLRMRDKIEATFDFPFWYGVQVYGDLWAELNSGFGTIKMENKTNQAKWITEGFWQKLPASLSAIYGLNHCIDLGANFGLADVLKPSKDGINFGVTFTARGGRIFG